MEQKFLVFSLYVGRLYFHDDYWHEPNDRLLISRRFKDRAEFAHSAEGINGWVKSMREVADLEGFGPFRFRCKQGLQLSPLPIESRNHTVFIRWGIPHHELTQIFQNLSSRVSILRHGKK